MKKLLFLLVILLSSAGLAANAFAIDVTGGDAASQAEADVILDIVFAFDTSYSMNDEITAVVASMESVVANLDCPDCDVWVRAKLMGITDGNYGLGENVRSYVYDQGGTPLSNQLEDNAPAVQDLVNYYAWNDDSTADQDYYKAVVTIGDEGTQDGYPVTEADWAAAYFANQAAIANDVMVFSVLGTPYYTDPADVAARDAVFTALAVGGSEDGITFGNTGGTVTHTTNSTIETDIEVIICTAASGGTGGNNAPVPEPATLLLLGTGLVGLAGGSRKKLFKK